MQKRKGTWRPAEWVGLIGLFLFALLLRMVYLKQMEESLLFQFPTGEERGYVHAATKGAFSGWIPSPLYPYLLRLIGGRYPLLRTLQLFIGALNGLLVYALGRRVFGKGVGVLAGLMMSVYGPLLYFEGGLVPTAFEVFIGLGLLLALLWTLRTRWWVGWGLVGVLLGLLLFTVPRLLPLVPVLVGCIGWDHERRVLPRASHTVGLLGGMALVLFPAVLGGVPLRSPVAQMFHVGQRVDYERALRGRSAYGDDVKLCEPTEDQGSGAAHLGKKFWLFWSGDEVEYDQDPYVSRSYSRVLRLLLWRAGLAFPFGLLGPLALAGIGLGLIHRRSREVGLFVWIIAAHVVAGLLFYVSSSTRASALPLLMLFGSYTLYWGYVQVRHRRFRALGRLSVAVVILMVVLNLPNERGTSVARAAAHHTIARIYVQKSMWASAMTEARAALEIDPNYLEPRYLLAFLSSKRRLYADAAVEYEKILSICPHDRTTRRALARVYTLDELYDRAIAHYKALIAEQPRAELYSELGGIYLKNNLFNEAIGAYQQAVHLDSLRAEDWSNLGLAYGRQGNHTQEILQYQRALQLRPDHAKTLHNLGVAYQQEGRLEEAVAALERAMRLNPGSLGTPYNLAIAYTEQGRYDEALALYQRVAATDSGYEHGRIYYDMAMLYEKKGEADRAAELMRTYEQYVNHVVSEQALRSAVKRILP